MYIGGYFTPSVVVLSGGIGSGEIGDGAVLSGNIGSGQVGSPHIADGTIVTADIASGAVASGELASGSVPGFFGTSRVIQSGTIGVWDFGSGAVIAGAMGSGAVRSGELASGQLGNFHFASGARIDAAEWMEEDTYTAAEPLSGATVAIGVAFTQSGTIQTAMAAVSGRMPAVGVVTANVASGGTVTLYRGGRVFGVAFSFSGWMNRPVYVGRSGLLSASGAPTSSGDIQQIMGVSLQQSGLMIQIGDALEQAVSASGDVGSGAVTGQAGGGYFVIASGTIGTNDLGSGAIVSGLIASGQVGQFHLASGAVQSGHVGNNAVTSGNIASGQVGINQIGAAAITSGQVAANAISTVHLLNAAVLSGKLGSGAVGQFHINSGAVVSGKIGSGAVLGQAAGGAFTIASGSIAGVDLSSGAVIYAALTAGGAPMVSGATTPAPGVTMITAEPISGVRAIAIHPSGNAVWIAMAAVSGRMPAVGVVTENVASGLTFPWFQMGGLVFGSGMVDFSGRVGRRIWVGRSGQLVATSGAWNSGGFASGDKWQPIGVTTNSGAGYLNVQPFLTSGGVTDFLEI